MTQDELKAVYFKFFDLLAEPYKEQAKANFNYKYASRYPEPLDCAEAVIWMKDWLESKEGFGYWNTYYILLRCNKELNPKTEETEETDEALRDRLKTQLAEVEARIEEKNRIKPGTPVWGWEREPALKSFGFYVEKNLSSHVIRRNNDPSSRVDLFENVERADISKF